MSSSDNLSNRAHHLLKTCQQPLNNDKPYTTLKIPQLLKMNMPTLPNYSSYAYNPPNQTTRDISYTLPPTFNFYKCIQRPIS